MIITDFRYEHIPEAEALALSCYDEERREVPALPEIHSVPALKDFADNHMGAAALENGRLVGFLCSVAPFDNVFRSTDVKGVFSPMLANAAILENRAAIYAALYQYAALKWVQAGAYSHAVCLYAHDEAALGQFFRYGFGLRCVDSIRTMQRLDTMQQLDTMRRMDGQRLLKSGSAHEGKTGMSSLGEFVFTELKPEEYCQIYPLESMLNSHFRKSPFFMNRRLESCEEFCEECVRNKDRCFAAFQKGEPCAYLKLSDTGETFITQASDYIHITGAFCLPEYRGRGLYQNLLDYAVDILEKEGYTRLGVDFESINPTAYRFCSKYFTAYTQGVVRRIDERIGQVIVPE